MDPPADLSSQLRRRRLELGHHVLKSLTWFEDAESQPMPRMLEPFDWEACKAFFVREAHAIVLP